jgi:hypothetical protein
MADRRPPRLLAGESIREARTDETRRAIFALRYRVNVSELGKPYDGADHESRLLRDDLDPFSLNLYVADTVGCYGAFRGTWGLDTFGHEPPWPNLRPLLPDLPPEQMALASRLVVDAERRGRSRTAIALMVQLYRQACGAGMRLCLCHTSERYATLCERVGWTRLGDSFLHEPSGTVQVPMVMRVDDVDHFARIQSPFLEEAARRFAAPGRLSARQAEAEAQGLVHECDSGGGAGPRHARA